MTPKTVGYVGLDHHHAEPYLRTLETLPVTVAGVCEPNPSFDVSSVSGLGDAAVYGSLETMLASESLEAVFLTLPNAETPEAVEQAVAAGVDVYTEKPASRTAAGLEPLVDYTEETDATVCVSYPWQSHPIASELRSLVDDGFFGDVWALDARFVASQVAYRDDSHFIFDADASRGGILQWLGIHWIQLFNWVLPDPVERVNASVATRSDRVDVEDSATLQLETASGALGTLQCGYYLGEGLYDTQFDIYGSDGRSSWDPIGREFGFDGETTLELDDTSGDWSSTPHRTVTHEYDSTPGYGGSWGKEFVRGFLDACDSGRDPPVSLADAVDVLRIIDAAYESAETDEWVSVEEYSR